MLCLLLNGCQQPPRTLADAQPLPPEAALSRSDHGTAQLRPAPGIAPSITLREVEPETIWQAMSENFALGDQSHLKAVKQEIKWLQRHPLYFQQRATAFASYMPYIAEELREYGIPGELALMPVIESALDPYAYSPGGAAGLWQFIDITAERFGLQRDWWYDGRRDVIAATDAAISYLSFLHQSFDDWLLVMAGYNAGEGTVRRALRRQRSSAHSSPSTTANSSPFWRLGLPRETRAYVPRVLAYAAVIKDPERYGIKLPVIANKPGFKVVTLPAQYDLMKVAKTLDLPINDLYRWNPAFNQWATPATGPHRVIVPTSVNATVASEQLAAIPEAQRMGWQRITVASGDTLSGLAQRHGTQVSAIRKANRLKNDQIRVGRALYIPKSSNSLSDYPVAKLHGGKAVTVGQGDSLWSIARAHDVRIKDLVRWNELNPKRPLRVGQKIHVGATDRRVVRKVRYKVRRGDSLSLIASRFNVRTADIVRWNSIDRGAYLKPGQRLTLHVNVAKPRATAAVGS